MSREPSVSDFETSVEGVGTFRFAKRTMRDHMKIEVEYARLIDGVQPTTWLSIVAQWLSTLRVLTVTAPDGWDLDNMDPLSQDTYAKLLKVHTALTDKEADFRGLPRKDKQEAGKEVGEDPAVLVPAEV